MKNSKQLLNIPKKKEPKVCFSSTVVTTTYHLNFTFNFTA
jgi:hypothetical protein